MKYWLMKTEPGKYSWDDLVKEKRTHWDGVRNYQARNNMMAMKKGDMVLIYHSVSDKEIVGTAEVVKEHYPDPTTTDERWIVVDIIPRKAFAQRVSLAQIKAESSLSEMSLVKQGRLSVTPVTASEWKKVVSMGR